MTAQTVAQATTTTETTVIVDKGAEFARILANVLPSAGKDETLPILTAVHVDVTADRITVAATDRYTLSVDYITRDKDSEVWPEVSFNLAGVDAGKVIKMLKERSDKFSPLTVTLGEHGKVGISTWSAGITSQLIDSEFPRYERLFEGAKQSGEDKGWTSAGFTPSYFARFTKIMVSNTGKPAPHIKLTFFGDDERRKPVLVTIPGYESFRALVMPVRLSG